MKIKSVILFIIIILLSCNDIKQKVTHKQVNDELHYTVTTTWTDSSGAHTITESYLDRDTAYQIKQKQLESAKEMREQNNKEKRGKE